MTAVGTPQTPSPAEASDDTAGRLVLTDLESQIERLVSERPSSHGRHCATNAIRHLKKAWRLQDIDAEMTVIRLIAAEEEAASSVFHALLAQRRVYPSATKLDPFDHVQKLAFTAFVSAMEDFLSKLDLPPHKLAIGRFGENDEFDGLHIRIRRRSTQGELQDVVPLPPLHGVIVNNGRRESFENEIREFLDAHGYKTARDHTRAQERKRRALLYATHEGLGSVSGGIAGYRDKQRRNVFRSLGIFLMIEPYRTRQDLVDQSLRAFLKMMKGRPDDGLADEWNGATNQESSSQMISIPLRRRVRPPTS